MKKIMMYGIPILILVIGYFLFISGDEFDEITEYKANLKDAKVNLILEKLDSNDFIKDFEIKDNDIIFTFKENKILKYEIIEKDAAIFYNLIEDLSSVTYNYNKETIVFSKAYIETIFKDLNSIKPSKIYNRYESKYFKNEDITYHGNILGKYDLFDESTFCSEEKEVVDEDEDYEYLISCTQINFLYIIDKKGNKTPLTEALGNEMIKGRDLESTYLEMVKEAKDENNN